MTCRKVARILEAAHRFVQGGLVNSYRSRLVEGRLFQKAVPAQMILLPRGKRDSAAGAQRRSDQANARAAVFTERDIPVRSDFAASRAAGRKDKIRKVMDNFLQSHSFAKRRDF